MNLELFGHLGVKNRARFDSLDFDNRQQVDWQKASLFRLADPSGYTGNSYNFELRNERIGWTKMFTSENDVSNQFILIYFYDGTYAEVSTKFGKTKGGKWRYYSKLFWMGALIGYIDDRQTTLFQSSPGFPLRIYDATGNHRASIGKSPATFGIGQDTFTWRQKGSQPLGFEVNSCQTREIFPRGCEQVYDMRAFLLVNCLFRMAIEETLDFAS